MGDLLFPLVCDQCSASAVVPCYNGTVVRSTFMILALRCGSCGHHEHVIFAMSGVTVARKPDRRRDGETTEM